MTACCALAYAWFTGFGIATVRATIMVLVLLSYQLLNLRPHALAAVSLAVMIMLLIRPLQVHDIGFQLSVAAVVAIVTLGRGLVIPATTALAVYSLGRWIDRAGVACCGSSGGACDALAIGIAASMSTAWLIAHYWQDVQVWSPIASLLIAMPLCVAIASGLSFIALWTIWPQGPWNGIAWLSEWAFATMQHIATTVSNWPHASVTVAPPTWWHAVIWIAIIAWPIPSGRSAVIRLIIVVLAMQFLVR